MSDVAAGSRTRWTEEDDADDREPLLWYQFFNYIPDDSWARRKEVVAALIGWGDHYDAGETIESIQRSQYPGNYWGYETNESQGRVSLWIQFGVSPSQLEFIMAGLRSMNPLYELEPSDYLQRRVPDENGCLSVHLGSRLEGLLTAETWNAVMTLWGIDLNSFEDLHALRGFLGITSLRAVEQLSELKERLPSLHEAGQWVDQWVNFFAVGQELDSSFNPIIGARASNSNVTFREGRRLRDLLKMQDHGIDAKTMNLAGVTTDSLLDVERALEMTGMDLDAALALIKLQQ